eukprot:TRINITY_DN11753_c0_g1_i1.p1 TRINITY_DN11753_c0_g1~~TRINITY_DN11753_c0_g1_i1.p1  ORF type:complete len:465 (-),score=142.11 TRINITY_DN11753_c0_g1_i1:461-1855(-)
MGEFGGRLPENATPKDNFDTMCIYAGQEPDPVTGSRVAAIHQNTGFVFKDTSDAAAKFSLSAFGPIYTRIGNPTCDAAEAKIAALEGGNAALSVASGHAAQMIAFTNLLQPGDNFVSTKQLYGGSVTQFSRQFAQFGWEVRFVDLDDYAAMEKAFDSKTKALYCEALCNPGGSVTDLEKLAEIAHKHGVPLVVDNTTATPYLCRPFEWGADVIVHSGTKYLAGHGNALCGFIVEHGTFDWGATPGKFPILASPCDSYHGLNFNETFGKDGPVAEMFGTAGEKGMAFVVAARALGLRDVGACLSPFNAFLVSMGMETLPLRMERHSYNALKVAEFLQGHPQVAAVSYAGLPTNKYHSLAKKYAPKGSSGLFTFSVKGGFEAAQKVVNEVQMISLVANLGDTRTLIAHPASMMHSQLTEEQQRAAGADPTIIRMSIGIECAKDIIDDLKQALDKAGGEKAAPKSKM